MAFARSCCGRVVVSVLIAMAFSMPLLQSSHARCAGLTKGTPAAVVGEIAAHSTTQRGYSGSNSAPMFGERAAEDSDREVPTGPDPLHHHFDPKVRH